MIRKVAIDQLGIEKDIEMSLVMTILNVEVALLLRQGRAHR